MAILCLWELTVRDSAAEIVLALFYFVAMAATLTWAALKVIRIAKRSVSLHKNPAYILYSDPTALNKWGFLYVQYRATAYYFILPQLGYILLKAIFIAFAQQAPVAQAVGLLILEALWLIGVCILRPWMDKKTNTFNISIAVINFLNAIFLLIFTNVFNTPVCVPSLLVLLSVLIHPRVWLQVSWALSYLHTTQSLLLSFLSWSWFLRSTPWSRRIPTPVISPCVMIVAHSSSPSRT